MALAKTKTLSSWTIAPKPAFFFFVTEDITPVGPAPSPTLVSVTFLTKLHNYIISLATMIGWQQKSPHPSLWTPKTDAHKQMEVETLKNPTWIAAILTRMS